ncbi:MAG: DUF554 domain-containing protein [Tissierellia bacterium]|jgi:uncharacterized membrane protein YqgA involved in biofilm formation|nr:DUF554 domain-containing protein [Bacillota bacterium]NLK59286.1 DUF554 domain-containing protein [Tissierellia bacterium]
MLGTVVNTAVVVIGALLGMLFKRGIPERVGDAVIKAFGLITLYIGISGAFKGESPYVMILSIALGTMVGEWLDLQKGIERFAQTLETRFAKEDDSRIAQGFISATLLFCMGAMAIVGSLEGGLRGDHTLIFTKSTLDFISAMFLAASLGIGVLFAAGSVFVYQGAIVLLAGLVAPFLSDPIITEISAVGSVLLMGLAFNLLGVTKLRIMNYIPAVLLPILLVPLFSLLM